MKASFSFLVWPLATYIKSAWTAQSEANTGKPIVIDTDIFSDVDDVGALAIANVLHNCGLADLQAVMINTNSKYGAVAASTINTYFQNPSIPIAALRPLTNDTYLDTWTWSSNDFATKLTHHFPHALSSAASAPDPVGLYLSLLSAAPDSSLTIISIGHLTNLYHLLHRHPSVSRLLAQKVREIVVMGGAYPSGREFNFSPNVSASSLESDLERGSAVIENAAAYTLIHLPASVPVTFLGSELGSRVLSGRGLRDRAPEDSPVRAAYEWYVGRCGTVRESWDPLTIVYGVLGLKGLSGKGHTVDGDEATGWFEFGNEDGGYNDVDARDGSNRWVPDPKVTNQHWLKLTDGLDEEMVGSVLTSLFAWDPRGSKCMLDWDGKRENVLRVQ